MNLILAFLLFSVIPSAPATSFYIRPLPDFAADASVIVRGKITKVHAEYGLTQNGERTIVTLGEVNVDEVLRGDVGNRITIRKLGGTKDGVTLEIAGSPDFKEGEDRVYLLGPKNSDLSHDVIGLQLGEFDLIEQNGVLTLKGGLLGYADHHDHSDGPEQPIPPENQKTWSLDQLRTLVKNQPQPAPKPIHNITPIPAPPSPPVSGVAQPSDTLTPPSNPEGVQNEPTPEIPYFKIFAIFGLILGIYYLFKPKIK